ncbi:hypothetical protein SAMN04487818_104245 [Actinokineospora terrae]|uniref:Uncharacterized protein n=1 Tax=Actinokineospora terrae TaxID=155974 RepID=A0A1H9QG75_9PSEU|nr:hypothetical protein SAMN04487818_104245 [Actinokineospora terrae]
MTWQCFATPRSLPDDGRSGELVVAEHLVVVPLDQVRRPLAHLILDGRQIIRLSRPQRHGRAAGGVAPGPGRAETPLPERLQRGRRLGQRREAWRWLAARERDRGVVPGRCGRSWGRTRRGGRSRRDYRREAATRRPGTRWRYWRRSRTGHIGARWPNRAKPRPRRVRRSSRRQHRLRPGLVRLSVRTRRLGRERLRHRPWRPAHRRRNRLSHITTGNRPWRLRPGVAHGSPELAGCPRRVTRPPWRERRHRPGVAWPRGHLTTIHRRLSTGVGRRAWHGQPARMTSPRTGSGHGHRRRKVPRGDTRLGRPPQRRRSAEGDRGVLDGLGLTGFVLGPGRHGGDRTLWCHAGGQVISSRG